MAVFWELVPFWMALALVLNHTVEVGADNCANTPGCQCLPGFITCQGVITLPDVLESRLLPLSEDPPIVADLKGNAFSEVALRRFLLVFPTLEKLILTDQLESMCDCLDRLETTFPAVTFVTDCQVSLFGTSELNE